MLQKKISPEKQGLFNLFDDKGPSEDTFSDSGYGVANNQGTFSKDPQTKTNPDRSANSIYYKIYRKMKHYIAYLRVSTKGQERSGLGLEAQRAIVEHYAKIDGAEIVKEVIEAESGKGMQNRPKLQQVIRECNEHGYSLIVAKLDRLSRDIHDTFSILKQLNQKLVSCDIPTQNGTLDTFTLAVFAGLAQRERELISIRTKQALQAKKARGAILGKPENLTNEARSKGAASMKSKAETNRNNVLARALIQKCKDQGLGLQQIADELNASGFKTSRGKEFKRMSVSRLI